jgi:peptidoglycan/LPS O-acetylase OafA/YrhL
MSIAKSTGADRPERRFYPQLDGLRAIAVLYVLLYHMSDLDMPTPIASVLGIHIGWIGVDAFFVLSGFLITRILVNTRPTPRSFGLFVLRRVLRTWPLYFVVLCLAYIMLRHDPSGHQINWLQHFFFVQNFTPTFVARSLGPTWSLCIEEHFYLVWPFVIFFVPRRALVPVLACVLIALPCLRWWGLQNGVPYKQLYTETQFHLDGMIAGGLVALLVSVYAISSRRLICIGYICLTAGALLSAIGFWHGTEVLFGNNVVFGFTTLAVGFSGLLILLIQSNSSPLVRAFSLRPLQYIGRISYGIYLLHDGVIATLLHMRKSPFIQHVLSSWQIAIPFRICLAIAVASVSYHFFEGPILRVKDRLR